jgi:transcriptional regulator with XRE-family HTH domain
MGRPKPSATIPEGEPKMLTQIREAVRDDGRTLTEIAESSGLDAGRLSRFVRGERDLSLAAAARLCEALGFELVRGPSPAKAEGRRKRGKS